MDENKSIHIIIQSSHHTAYYSEQETAQYSRLEVQVIRELHDAGVIEGISVAGEEPRYNEEEVAVRYMQQAYENRDWALLVLAVEPRLDSLRRDPRFQEISAKLKFP